MALSGVGLRGVPQALAVYGRRALPGRIEGTAVREPNPDRRVEGVAVGPGRRQPPYCGLGGPLRGGRRAR
ncbi:hypothetical protein [Streptomyces sp. MBT62]|uniref:hypothetical protein n=1 Tax=Streptomyces sp. MBT62 TaxID=2800410 RepID=UPI00190D1DC1|nr:hypothetical protein [Streptomyces sp. MBT62]MBK3568899.1 hypothetical protein [Streptomyces sp. MBT62]